MVLRQSQLLINSLNRDAFDTTTTSDFYITPAQPLFNVVKIELRAAIIEDGIYNVTTENNRFGIYSSFDSFGSVHEVAFAPGYYDPNSLSAALQSAINNAIYTASGELMNNVSINVRYNRIYFESTESAFVLDFTDVRYYGAAALLGFRSGNYYASKAVVLGGGAIKPVPAGRKAVQTGASSNQQEGLESVGGGPVPKPITFPTNGLTSPLAVTLQSYDYVMLQSQKLGNRITSAAGFAAFALIPLFAGDNAPFVSNSTSFIDSTYFIQKTVLDRIDVKIIDATGKVVDLQGNNVSLLFDIVQDLD